MEFVLPLAGAGFALGWPIEWLIQRFPKPDGTAPSSRRRWIVAAVTAALFAAVTIKIGFQARLAPALLLTALVVPASVIDLRHRIIPNAINFPGAVAVYMTAVIAEPHRWAELLIGGVAAALFLGIAWLIYPAGMGLGDVKMTLMIGLALGRYAGVALFAAFAISLLPSIAVLVLKGPRGRKVSFPFGPFLAFGAMVAILYGPELWNAWYVGT
jgi:leader peptidase (prepilin peptidase)/N-methyltransferase